MAGKPGHGGAKGRSGRKPGGPGGPGRKRSAPPPATNAYDVQRLQEQTVEYLDTSKRPPLVLCRRLVATVAAQQKEMVRLRSEVTRLSPIEDLIEDWNAIMDALSSAGLDCSAGMDGVWRWRWGDAAGEAETTGQAIAQAIAAKYKGE